MKPIERKHIVAWNVAALVAGLLPIALFGWLFARVPNVEVAQAQAMLRQTNAAAALVDVRPPEACASNPVAGAVNWPFEAIVDLDSAERIPTHLRQRTLLLMCETGLSSALAAQRLRGLGVHALNVAGGWIAWRDYGDGRKSALPFRAMTAFEQWLAVIVAFGIKPLYMLVSLGLMVWVWRQPARDLAALRWGLIWFWIGENACSIDYLFFKRSSDFWEFLHGHGMAVSFSFIAYAILEGFDYRLVKFSPEKERCAALNLCRACYKYADAPCGLKRLFLILIPALAVLAVMPWTADFVLTAYVTEILGTAHVYYHLASSQLYELRFAPALAVLLLAASWLVLKFRQREPVAVAKVLMAAALGPLGFSLLRMFFVATFREHLMWFDVWEEITELLFMGGIGAVLWVFRHGLFVKEPAPVPAAVSGLHGGGETGLNGPPILPEGRRP